MADQATFTLTPNPAIGRVPLTVEFTMCDINEQSAQDKKAAVDFGDGQGSAESCKATHTYVTPGTYQATLRFKHQSVVMSVQAMPSLEPVITLSASPNPVSGIEPSTITMTFTDPRGEAMTWTARVETPDGYPGTVTPASGGPVPSGGTATTVYQTSGGLDIGTITVTAINTSALSSARSIVIPTCQPSGRLSYPSDSGGPYPVIPVGGSIIFTIEILDCPGIAVTISATVENSGGGALVLSPADGTALPGGTVLVTFQSLQATTALITITGTDSLGFTNMFLPNQPVVVQ